MILSENLKKKKFVVTAEIQPPIGAGAGELVKNVERIRGRVDALTVPELKIEGLVADTMGTCRILREQKFDPILQTACRDRNRVELQEYLLRASEAGIENILTFTEDYRITGDSLQEIMFFHVDSGKLFSVVENIREGQDISGKELPGKSQFLHRLRHRFPVGRQGARYAIERDGGAGRPRCRLFPLHPGV